MKKVILSLLALFASCALSLQAQEISTLDGYPPLDYSVVRQYTNYKNIHYCDDGTQHYFLLYDITTPNTAIWASFPSYLFVKDFEIKDDVVYFCGTFPNGGNPYGFVGQISVADLFYNNGNYNIGILNYTVIGDSNYTYMAHMASCDRMDIYSDKSKGIVHLAVVGEFEHGIYYNMQLCRSAGDFWFDGTNWVGSALYQKHDYYKTSDITCTKDYIVVSGYDDDPNYSILAVFYKVQNFPYYPILPNTIHLMDRRYKESILVERLQGNDVAVTHYYEDLQSGTYGTALHYINDVSLLPTPLSYFSLHYVHGTTAPVSTQRDLRYSNMGGSNSLLLLHDIAAPLWNVPTSSLFDFDAYNLPSLLMNVWHRSNDVSLLAVDNRVSSPMFSLGGNYNVTGEPLLTIKRVGTSNCYTGIRRQYTNITPQVRFTLGIFEEDVINFIIPPLNNLFPNPKKKDVTVKCD